MWFVYRGAAGFSTELPHRAVESDPVARIGLQEFAAHLDEYLRIAEVPDYPAAFNGLQVERVGDVGRVAVAVDATQATIEGALAGGADLLLVHHGLFWSGMQPLTGRRYRRVRALVEGNLALYGAHLPLDVHPEVGNNAALARAIGLEVEGVFGDFKGLAVGVWGRLPMRREALAARLDEVLGCRVRMVAGGPERVGLVGIITGGAGGQIDAAREAGLDAFITGEGAHHHYFDATEGGVNLYLGGHYATETWGVRALAAHLSDTLGVETFFVDRPTGL
jgi:dinuclear metal center YbgI/SA1388 family protein